MQRFQLRNASTSRYGCDDSVLALAEGRLRSSAMAVRVSAGRYAAVGTNRLLLAHHTDVSSDRGETRVACEP